MLQVQYTWSEIRNEKIDSAGNIPEVNQFRELHLKPLNSYGTQELAGKIVSPLFQS